MSDEPEDLGLEAEDEPMVEIYHCHSPAEAAVICDEVLAPNGVDGYIHDRTSHSFPAPDAATGSYSIAVYADQAKTARELLHEAIASGILMDDGAFAEAEAASEGDNETAPATERGESETDTDS